MDISKFENIKDALAEGEKPVWVGRPVEFGLTDGGMKTPVMLRIVICAVLAVALLAAYIAVYAGTEVFQPLMIVVILAVFGFFALRPAMDRSNLIKRTVYCITDKRVILGAGNDVFDISRSGLKTRIVDAGNGNVHVALGKCVETAENKYRVASLAPQRGKGDMVTGFVMYNVDKCVGDYFVS